MVEVSLNDSADTLQVSQFVIRIIRKRFLAVTHTMRLDVRLIHDIKAITVTEGIPHRVIRIMACTDSIDIQAFHNLDILNHICFRHYISLIWVHFVPVGSLDEDRLAVHQKLSVADFHIPEAELQGSCFCLALVIERVRIICFVKSRYIECIKPRSFRTPLLYIWNKHLSPCCILSDRALHQ